MSLPTIGRAPYGAAAGAGTLSLPTSALAPALPAAGPALAGSPSATAFTPLPVPVSVPAAAVPMTNGPDPMTNGPDPRLAGDIRYIRNFPSEALGNSRTIAVYLPPGYESSSERYPVLYMQDGQNLFDASTAYNGNSWDINETCVRMMLSGELPPFIVAAVYNTKARTDEYTPVADEKYGGGNGEAYGKFLIKELKPYIDANLRTLPDAANTGIMGSSLGGLISLHLAFARPDVFLRVGGPSASLWFSNQELTKRLKSAPPPSSRPRVWIDMGTREGEHPDDRVEETLALGKVLVDRGWTEGDDLAVHIVPGAGHNEIAWRARAAEILKFLFPIRP
ncbi:MAG: alpha/beta hydrolase [Elusimicrobiota bacterium]